MTLQSVNWIDVTAVALLVVYTLGGYATGMFRRAIGLAAVVAGMWFGTKLGLTTAPTLMQIAPLDAADARMACFLGFLIMVAFLVEILTLFNHDVLKLSVVPLDRSTGALAGAFTAVLLIAILFPLLSGYSNPAPATGAPGATQVWVHDMEQTSVVAARVAGYDNLGGRAYGFLQQLLPVDSQRYFTSLNPPPA